MKRDSVDGMFPFPFGEWGSKYEPKCKEPGDLNKVCRQPPCLSSTRK